MAGTRTAPTINGTPTFLVLSISLIDYTGDRRTDTYQIDADSTVTEIEALVAAIQACSNASIYRVTVGDVYNSAYDASQAVEAVWENAKDNIVILEKNATDDSQDFYVPAPLNDAFVEGTENVDPTDSLITDITDAITPIRSGYTAISARLTHRKQIGKKVAL